MKRALLPAALAVVFCCRGQTLDERSRFVEDGVGKDAPAEWSGEKIEIDNAGVTPSGGLAVSAGDGMRVHAVARMLAIADTADKANADQAILSATESYVVTTSAGVTTVRCGHGATFASAAGNDSGCDALDVSVPRGTLEKHLSVVARSGNGKVVASLGGAVLAELNVHASHGTVDVSADSTQGAAITIVSETGDDITLRLPQDFAADAVVLEGASDKLDTSAFPDVVSGKGRGAAGAGAKSITIRSGAPGGAGPTGRIALVAQRP